MKVKAAGIFVVRKDKTLLICHPTNHAMDFWSIPKGKVEDGETTLQAAIRETYEESNLYLSGSAEFDIHVMSSVNYTHGKKELHPFLFHENASSNINWVEVNKTIKCNSDVPDERGDFPEMDDYKWISLDEAKDLLHYTQVACIDKIIEIIM